MRRPGFTLVELLIVVIIIAVLAGIAVPIIQHGGRSAREAKLQAQLALIRAGLERCAGDTGLYPQYISDLTLTTCPVEMLRPSNSNVVTPDATTWKGPYLEVPGSDRSSDGLSFVCPVGGGPIAYDSDLGNGFRVSSTASGVGLNGKAYTTW